MDRYTETTKKALTALGYGPTCCADAIRVGAEVLRWAEEHKETCEWIWDGDEASDTSCGFIYGGRIVLDGDEKKQPDFTFCPYCGRRIAEKK